MSIRRAFQPLSAHAARDRQVWGGFTRNLRHSNAPASNMGTTGKPAKQRLDRHPVAVWVQQADHAGFGVVPQGNLKHAPVRNLAQTLGIPVGKGCRTLNRGTRRVVYSQTNRIGANGAVHDAGIRDIGRVLRH